MTHMCDIKRLEYTRSWNVTGVLHNHEQPGNNHDTINNVLLFFDEYVIPDSNKQIMITQWVYNMV